MAPPNRTMTYCTQASNVYLKHSFVTLQKASSLYFVLIVLMYEIENSFNVNVVDFSSDIADHTLEQMPNALYQGKRKVKRKMLLSSRPAHNATAGHDSTDSEELDHSDSGYSSPMHRQNQISSGTDARRTKTSSESSNSNSSKPPIPSVGRLDSSNNRPQASAIAAPAVPVTHSVMCTHPYVTVSQAQSGVMSSAYRPAAAAVYSRHQPLTAHHITHNSTTAAAVCMSYASALQASRPTTSLYHSTDDTERAAAAVEGRSNTVRTAAEGLLDDGANSDEAVGEDDDVNGSVVRKKKRKRGRRRRKRGE